MSKPLLLLIDDNLPYLLLNINVPTGGASVQALSWLSGLVHLFRVKIVTDKVDINEINGIEILKIPRFNKIIGGIFHKRNYIYNLLLKEKPDFIFVTVAGINTFLWGKNSQKLKIRYIQRISNDIVYEKNTYFKKLGVAKYLLSRFNLKYADTILCQNEYQRTNIKRLLPKKNINIIYNPFDIIYDIEIKKHCDREYVAWVGIFQYQKNMEALFEVAHNNPNIYFRVAGKPEKTLDEYTQKSINKLQKLRNVQFIGFLSRIDIFEFLSKAYCLLNTSYYEGFSNTYLESFSVGTPVVTTNKTDPDGIIKKFNLGLVYEDHSQLTLGVNFFINSSEFNYKNLRDYLIENHKPIIIVKKMIKYLENK